MNEFSAPEILNCIDEKYIISSEAPAKVLHPSSYIKAAIVSIAVISLAIITVITGVLLFSDGQAPLAPPTSQTTLVSNNDFKFQGSELSLYSGSAEKVTIPKGVLTISKDAFKGSLTVKEIVISDSIISIDAEAFLSCPNLEKISIECNVNFSIVEGMLLNKDKTEILFVNKLDVPEVLIIPQGVTEIPEDFLRSNKTIKELILPSSVLTIKSHAFDGCSNLEKVTLGGTKTIESNAFSNTAIKEVSFKKHLMYVGENAFYNSKVRAINIYGRNIYFASNAFLDSELIGVYFDGTFEQCEKLMTHFENFPNMSYYGLGDNTWEIGLIYRSNGDGTCAVYSSDHYLKGEVVIPSVSPRGDLVTAIERFVDCSNITSVIMPDSITTVSDNAFSNCSDLKTVKFSNGMTELPRRVFLSCSSVEKIILPENLNKINSGALSGITKLIKFTVPETVTELAVGAFCDSNFRKIDLSKTSISIINKRTFAESSNLKEVTLPATITSIKAEAFKNCNRLTTIYFEGSQEDWNKIEIDNYGNDILYKVNIIFGTEQNQSA